MPQLTEEDVAKLYPRAKSYDELQTEREFREAERRPKYASARIALWASLSVPAITIPYYASLRIVAVAYPVAASGSSSSSMAVLAGVSLIILLSMIGLAILYYLRSLIDSIVSKTIVATRLFYLVLIGILCIAGGIGGVLYFRGYSLALITLALMFWVSLTSFIAAKKIEDYH